MIFPLGALVNGLAIALGALLGRCIGSRIPEKMRELIFQGLGLCVFILGLQSALTAEKLVLTIASIVCGSIIGELIDIEGRFIKLGNKLKRITGSSNPRFTEGFINGSLLFCIGALAILCSIEEGLKNVRDMAYTKSAIDFFSATILATGLGLGVAFSGIVVFLYQGCIVLMASLLASFITPPLLAEITATGGILILAIGFNMLGLVKIRIGNMLPSIFITPLLAIYF